MITFHFLDPESRYLFITADNTKDEKDLGDLKHYMNKVPMFCYLPQYKGIPYTEDFLFSKVNSAGKRIWYAAIGLCQTICDWLKSRHIPYSGIQASAFRNDMPSLDEFKYIVDSWNMDITPRDYQYEAAWNILKWKQSLSQIATRAGKTLIAYIVFRYLREHKGVENILMIVPSVQLVKQGYSDFSAYAEFFKTQCIWAGGSEVESSDLTIGTFQSLIKKLDRKSPKYNPGWFDRFDAVFVDEVHRATASQVRDIISQPFFSDAKLVFGMTGTLPPEHTIEAFTISALLGTKIQDISARELMDSGYITEVMIHQLDIRYPQTPELDSLYIKAAEYLLSDTGKHKEPLQEPHFLYKYVKQLPRGIEIARDRLGRESPAYRDYLKDLIKQSDSTNFLLLERMILHDLPQRLDMLKELIHDRRDLPGNWLVLTHHKEYTKHVYEILSKEFPDKKLYKIDSQVTVKRRTNIVEGMKDGNSILVASYGCMSTGITLPKLEYGVLFESFKSSYVNIQSIGRGLGNSEGKDRYELWDFVDTLPTKVIAGQGKERAKIYKKQKYNFETIDIDPRTWKR